MIKFMFFEYQFYRNKLKSKTSKTKLVPFYIVLYNEQKILRLNKNILYVHVFIINTLKIQNIE